MSSLTPRDLFERYAPAVAYVSVRLPSGDEAIGSAFHVGEGAFVTARHVVEGCKILEIANTVHRYVPEETGLVTIRGREGRFRSVPRRSGVSSAARFATPTTRSTSQRS